MSEKVAPVGYVVEHIEHGPMYYGRTNRVGYDRALFFPGFGAVSFFATKDEAKKAIRESKRYWRLIEEDIRSQGGHPGRKDLRREYSIRRLEAAPRG